MPRPLSRVNTSRLPSISPVFTLLVFVTRNFSEVGESVQRSTPNLEDQGTSLSLTPTLRPVRQGWPYQYLRYRRHSSPGYWGTQAPVPRQGGGTNRGGCNVTKDIFHYIVLDIKYDAYKRKAYAERKINVLGGNNEGSVL